MRPHITAFAAILLLLVAQTTLLGSVEHTWLGSPIAGERPDFFPSGSAEFEIINGTLTITLTNDSPEIRAIGEVLTGLTWDITDSGVSLAPLSAEIPLGSELVGVHVPTPPETDMSSEWAFRDDLSAGSSVKGPLGSFGIGAMGDVNLGADTFLESDRFDTSTNLFDPSSGSVNGIEPGLVGPHVDLTSGGFQNHGPVVQGSGDGQTVFTFTISGTLTDGEITNVQPLFGTDGATITPEPSSLIVWSLLGGLIGLRWWRRGRRNGLAEATSAATLPGRTPWPGENRKAILEIINRGRIN